jgi:hypothetical protein
MEKLFFKWNPSDGPESAEELEELNEINTAKTTH